MELNNLEQLFPDDNISILKRAIKYQEKFQLTYENLKCLNPDCKHLRKWQNVISGFYYTCGSQNCKEIMKTTIKNKKTEKIINTNLEKYGVTSTAKLESTKEKAKETCLKKYGVIAPGQLESTKEKAKETCLKKYGVTSISKLESTIKKRNLTYFNKTGYIHNSLHPNYKNNHNIKYINNYINWDKKDFWLNNFFIIDDIDITKKYFDKFKAMLYFQTTSSPLYKQLKKLEINYNKVKRFSLKEKIISSFLDNLGIKYITNTKEIINPLELDIYIPEYKIAIEFNGIYWHSYCPNIATNLKQQDLYYNKNRHLIKTKECQKQGIKLFHIFENEWDKKEDIWKSVLSNALGKSKKLGARKCSIQIVPKKDIRPFLEQNHLQGYGNSPIAYGLYHNNELVSIMTFVKVENKQEYELKRFCNKIGYNVQGAASRLLKVFRNNYSGIVKSYANRRWSDGNLYRQIGFKEIGISIPNHFYWKNNIYEFIPRQTFQKHKLEKLFSNFDSTKTAIDNVINNGYNIIWDSGNYIFKIP
jgi:G:T-mismatch repair DNA endonuclease (very short patch repair protein)